MAEQEPERYQPQESEQSEAVDGLDPFAMREDDEVAATAAGTGAEEGELGSGLTGVDEGPGYLEPGDASGAETAQVEAAPARRKRPPSRRRSSTRSRSSRRQLDALPGDWYVLHTYAGYEGRVKSNLEQRTASLNMEDYIFQIEVPTEEVVQVKGGKRADRPAEEVPGLRLHPDGPDRRVVVRGPQHPQRHRLRRPDEPAVAAADRGGRVDPGAGRREEAGRGAEGAGVLGRASRSPSPTARSRRCRRRSAR